MDREAWWVTVHRVTKSRTQQKKHSKVKDMKSILNDFLKTTVGQVFQWLRLCNLNAAHTGLISAPGTRSHMPQLKIPYLQGRSKILHAHNKDMACISK